MSTLHKLVICGAFTISLLPSGAYAADFRIGNVKRTFPTDSACVSFNPKMPEKSIVVQVQDSAWMNINGKDIQLKFIDTKNVNQKNQFIDIKVKDLKSLLIRHLLIRMDQRLKKTTISKQLPSNVVTLQKYLK